MTTTTTTSTARRCGSGSETQDHFPSSLPTILPRSCLQQAPTTNHNHVGHHACQDHPAKPLKQQQRSRLVVLRTLSAPHPSLPLPLPLAPGRRPSPCQAPARLKHPRPLYKLHTLKVSVLSKTETEKPPLPKKSKGHDAFISTYAVLPDLLLRLTA